MPGGWSEKLYLHERKRENAVGSWQKEETLPTSVLSKKLRKFTGCISTPHRRREMQKSLSASASGREEVFSGKEDHPAERNPKGRE